YRGQIHEHSLHGAE
nr:immunoglobulin heavy chain junction region [Homo sapiens]